MIETRFVIKVVGLDKYVLFKSDNALYVDKVSEAKLFYHFFIANDALNRISNGLKHEVVNVTLTYTVNGAA